MRENTVQIRTEQGLIDVNILASFSLDNRDYCWLEDPENGQAVLFRFYSDKEEMVFELVSDVEEYEEAGAAYRELISESKESSDMKGMENIKYEEKLER